MKLVTRRIILLMVMMTLIFTTLGVANAADYAEPQIKFSEEDYLAYYEALSRAQAPAIELYHKFYEKYVLLSDDGNKLYPNKYGGAYLTDDNKLAIYVVNDDSSFINELNVFFERSTLVVYKYTDLSLNDLYNAHSLCKSLLGDYVTGCSINQFEQTVKLKIEKGSTSEVRKKINEIASELNELSYVRLVENECTTEFKSIYGGRSIYRNGDMSSTIGFAGTYNGEKAIIMAAHGYYSNITFSDGETIIKTGSTPYVSFADTNQDDECPGDFAIVLLNNPSTHTLCNYAYPSYTMSTYADADIVVDLYGEYILKYGVITQLTAAQVTDTDEYGLTTYNNQMVYIKNLLIAETDTQGYEVAKAGDSGGPVWRVLEDNTRQLIGIVRGGNAPDYNQMVFTSIAPIISQGFAPYGLSEG